MKKFKAIITLTFAAATLATATTTFAANGTISANEQAILDLGAKGITINGKHFAATQAQINEKRNEFLAATTDISDADLAKIKADVTEAKNLIASSLTADQLANISSLEDLYAALPAEVKAKVQALAAEVTNLAHIQTTLPVTGGATTAATTSSPVKQTGTSMVGFNALIVLVSAASVAGVAFSAKKWATK
ncbi:MAG: hypothetical protein LBN08_03790 [Lactobacillales bacterium]|jgi:hypothetical protein|nr:hypothetical protein [Lactobacillales bacterium]